MARDRYMRQVELLVRTLPYIARQDVFALKGERPSTCSTGICLACRSTSTSLTYP